LPSYFPVLRHDKLFKSIGLLDQWQTAKRTQIHCERRRRDEETTARITPDKKLVIESNAATGSS